MKNKFLKKSGLFSIVTYIILPIKCYNSNSYFIPDPNYLAILSIFIILLIDSPIVNSSPVSSLYSHYFKHF